MRYEKIDDITRRYKDEYNNVLAVGDGRAFRHCWTFEHICKWHNDFILKGERNTLPRYAIEGVQAHYDALYNQFQRRFIWTILLDGKRYLSKSPELEGRYQETEGEKCDHAYHVRIDYHDGRSITLLLPYRETIRNQDIEEGRLNADDVKMACYVDHTKGKVTHLIPYSSINNFEFCEMYRAA